MRFKVSHHQKQFVGYNSLPPVLLGMRSALKADIGHSSAELVYGTPLTLPGELFMESKMIDYHDFVDQLHKYLQNIKPTPTSKHGSQKIFIHKDLQHCTHVMVQRAIINSGLKLKYHGRFPILAKHEKYYELSSTEKGPTYQSIGLNRLS